MDFSLPLQTPWGLRWVHVEVDGETHFSKPRQGGTVTAQFAKDRKKEGAAWEQNLMLVRLHHADQRPPPQPCLWRQALAQAVAVAKLERPHRFIIFTPSYSQLGLETRVEAIQVGPPPCPALTMYILRPW